MVNYGYHLARAQGRMVESIYEFFLPQIVKRNIKCVGNIPIDVFSYSGRSRLPEQVASIRSFLTNAGRPTRFVVVSDGTHSTNDVELLRQVDECISVEQVPPPPTGAPAMMHSYLGTHSTGKQLALLMSLPRDLPALYLDSDVLFFSAADELGRYLAGLSAPAYYLEDAGFAGDERLLHEEDEKSHPVNVGTLLLRRPLNWTESVNRFRELGGEPNFFTSQTMTHLTMHANGALPFDRAKYVLNLDDQFIYADLYAGPEIVLRHYVNPVRHKFWTSLNR